MVWAESIYSFGGGGNKEFSLLFVLFGLHDLLDPRNSLSFVSCVRTYNSQVFRARIREVLPEVRCKWDGRLGTVFTGFELIEYASVLTGQRIFTNKRKGCWFKTQKVWGKFQRKVVAELELLFVTRLNLHVEAKAILQKEHITLLRKKGYAFGAFWRISLVTFFWNTHFPYLL